MEYSMSEAHVLSTRYVAAVCMHQFYICQGWSAIFTLKIQSEIGTEQQRVLHLQHRIVRSIISPFLVFSTWRLRRHIAVLYGDKASSFMCE